MNEIHRELIEKMAAEAVRELEAIRHPSAGARLKAAAKSVMGRSSGSKDPIFWPAGLLMLGLVEAGHTQEVCNYLRPWMQDGMKVQHPDDALTGEVLLRLYEEAGDNPGKQTQGFSSLEPAAFKEGADRILDYLTSCRRDAEGSIVYGQQAHNSYIFADGAGQTAMFLLHYGRLFHSEKVSMEGEKQLGNFLLRGMDPVSGLPYHGYDAETGNCYGIIGWGRAVGWLLFGLSELNMGVSMKAGEGESGAKRSRKEKELHEALGKLLGACRARIREDGMFSWQLDCRKGPADTSAAGMIFWAMNRFWNSGWRDTSYPDRREMDRAAEAMLRYVDAEGRVGQASAECVDFGQYRQTYGNFPWGQGAALMFLAAYDKSCR